MVKRYVILVVVMVVMIFSYQEAMKWLAKVKYERQRDQEVTVNVCEIGQLIPISGCEVMITEAQESEETDLPEGQQMLSVHYTVKGSQEEMQQLSLCTLIYINVDGIYISAQAYTDVKKEYSAHMDKGQGELFFIIPENAENISFCIYEYVDIVETQQVQGNMFVYKPYTAPEMNCIFEVIVRGQGDEREED